MSKGSRQRPGEIPKARWDAIFKPGMTSPQHGPATGCNCDPGDCKALTAKQCKDWMKRGGK
ncbi:MAG: hypothetical protein WA191_07210 [Telluria sp.]